MLFQRQLPFSQCSPSEQVPQVTVPPHPSGMVPHSLVLEPHDTVGVQRPQRFAVPPPPHVSPLAHVPQFSVPPQPSARLPQFEPLCAQVPRVQCATTHSPVALSYIFWTTHDRFNESTIVA